MTSRDKPLYVTPFDQLLAAARVLLSKRYRDGEVDSAALHAFEAEIEHILDTSGVRRHVRTVESAGDEKFLPRLGCCDCNLWLQPVRLRENT